MGGGAGRGARSGGQAQLCDILFKLHVLFDPSTSSSRRAACAVLKQSREVKTGNLVTFLSDWESQLERLEATGMLDTAGDYCDFVAPLFAAVRGAEKMRYTVEKWRDENEEPVAKTPRKKK